MPGLLSAMEGFCVIGIVIATGYVAARMRIGGPTAQMVLNRFSFFVSSPCLMFAILSKEKIFEIFHSSIVVAFFSAVLVGVVFLILNRLFFHMKAADATIGALNSLYLNSNNIGLPIATYILGNPALVAPILVMQQAVFTPIGLTVLDVTTKGKVSAKEILKQPLHQPLLIGSLLGIAVSAISAEVGFFVIPSCIYDPINMIGNSAVPISRSPMTAMPTACSRLRPTVRSSMAISCSPSAPRTSRNAVCSTTTSSCRRSWPTWASSSR